MTDGGEHGALESQQAKDDSNAILPGLFGAWGYGQSNPDEQERLAGKPVMKLSIAR